MTEYTILTTSEEVNDIYNGNRRFIMRSVHDNMKQRYVITMVENWHTAPILKKWLLVGFKEIKND